MLSCGRYDAYNAYINKIHVNIILPNKTDVLGTNKTSGR